MKYIANPIEVDAFKITEVRQHHQGRGLALTIDRERDSIVFATGAMTARINPKVGDYWVVQSDGYIYVNPKDVFERKYSPMPTDYLDLRRQIGDYRSTFYGPHKCLLCGEMVIKQAADQGGVAWILLKDEGKYMVHREPIKVDHGETNNPR